MGRLKAGLQNPERAVISTFRAGFRGGEAVFGCFEVGFGVSEVGFHDSELGFHISEVGFRISEVGFRISELGFHDSEVGFGKSGVGERAHLARWMVSPGAVSGHTLPGGWCHRGR